MTASQLARRRRNKRRQQGNGGGSSKGLRIALIGLVALLLLAITATAGAAMYGKQKYDEFVADVVPPEQLLAEFPRGGARVYDRNGVLLYEFVDEFSGLRRPVPLNDISDWMVRATIATEDASFYDNSGLNWRGIIRAGWENFSPFGDEFLEGSGGSSITQQLAKNVYIPKDERSDRSVERKLKEAAIALELTNTYTKDQILEWYLNSISYGGIYVGVEAAAEGYFGKTASELSLAEAVLLAGIPQSPARYDPIQHPLVATARQQEVLELMVRHGQITAAQADTARQQTLVFKANRFEIEAPHFVLGRIADEIKQRFGERALFEDGLEVTTTLDLGLQDMAQEILEGKIAENEENSNGHNGAMVAIDPHTGQILVYVGSRDYFRDDIEGRNDNIISLNSPGSTLKPFTYMTAFMQGWGTGTAILDLPASIIDPGSGLAFTPRNPSGNFQGIITVEDALGNSLNVPAFKAILFAGVGNVVTVLNQVGITSLDPERGYGPALTLGGVDITLGDLAYAYTVLANNGVMKGQEALVPHDPGERALDPVALLKVVDADGNTLYEFKEPDERRVVAAPFAGMVTSILSDPNTQCITFGCGGLNLSSRPSAQKTGTSEPFVDSRAIGDTWAFGYTPDLVAGVWAGNSDNSPMVNITSTRISGRSWREFMEAAHEYLELAPKQFELPPGIVERELCWPSGRLPTDICPQVNRYDGLLAEQAIPDDPDALDALQDTWWQEVQIDIRTGLLATPATPSAFVSSEVRLVFPEDETEDWGDGMIEWAARFGIVSLLVPAGDSTNSGQLLAVIAPTASEQVSGLVPILGRALSHDFSRYVVEWGRGNSPTSWVRFQSSGQQLTQGVLATWDTTTVPDGPYTIRVVLTDRQRGELRFLVPVTVSNGDEGALADLAPFATISSPLDGSVVEGSLFVSGIAVSGSLLDWVLQFGGGLQPTSWVDIERSTTPVGVGPLTVWDTSELENGLYTLRLTVRDRTLGSATVTIVVNVRN